MALPSGVIRVVRLADGRRGPTDPPERLVFVVAPVRMQDVAHASLDVVVAAQLHGILELVDLLRERRVLLREVIEERIVGRAALLPRRARALIESILHHLRADVLYLPLVNTSVATNHHHEHHDTQVLVHPLSV